MLIIDNKRIYINLNSIYKSSYGRSFVRGKLEEERESEGSDATREKAGQIVV